MNPIGTGPQVSLNSTHAAQRTGPSADASRIGASFRPAQPHLSGGLDALPQLATKPLDQRVITDRT